MTPTRHRLVAGRCPALSLAVSSCSGNSGDLALDITLGGYRDQDRWPTIQDAMIDAMIRLDKALAPHIAKLKTRSALN